VLAPLFVLVGALHLALGLQADVAFGATLPLEAIADPRPDG